MSVNLELQDVQSDPVAFVRLLRNPMDGRPFDLFPAQEIFMREYCRRGDDNRLLTPEGVFSAIKKSGKTTLGAWLALFFAVSGFGGRYAEVLIAAADLMQAQDRVFSACLRICEASFNKKQYRVTKDRITFPNGASIMAIASDWRGASGGNQSLVVFDEIWSYDTEALVRLWDEVPPSPARQISGRLVTSYAGYSGQSELLEGIYRRGLEGELIAPDLYRTADGLLFAHLTRPIAPWQTEKWIAQQRASLRPSAFQRQILNQFASGAEEFIDISLWDQAAALGAVA
jgi:hypothetical protein